MSVKGQLLKMLETVAEALGNDLREKLVGRGGGDPLGSRDLEDILLIVDGRPEIVAEVQQADVDVRHFIAKQFAALLKDPNFDFFLDGNVRGPEGRVDIVRERFTILSGDGD